MRIDFADFIDSYDVRMYPFGSRLGFDLKSLQQFRRRAIEVDDFEGNGSVQSRVVSLVYFAHRTRAQQFDQPILAKLPLRKIAELMERSESSGAGMLKRESSKLRRILGRLDG